MSDCFFLRKELKERFIKDLTISERLFFLNKAQESIFQKGFPACEDLYHFCYFLTLKQRLSSITPAGYYGFQKVLLVYGMKDLEDTIELHEQRLKAMKKALPDNKDFEFIEFFSKAK